MALELLEEIERSSKTSGQKAEEMDCNVVQTLDLGVIYLVLFITKQGEDSGKRNAMPMLKKKTVLQVWHLSFNGFPGSLHGTQYKIRLVYLYPR